MKGIKKTTAVMLAMIFLTTTFAPHVVAANEYGVISSEVFSDVVIPQEANADADAKYTQNFPPTDALQIGGKNTSLNVISGFQPETAEAFGFESLAAKAIPTKEDALKRQREVLATNPEAIILTDSPTPKLILPFDDSIGEISDDAIEPGIILRPKQPFQLDIDSLGVNTLEDEPIAPLNNPMAAPAATGVVISNVTKTSLPSYYCIPGFWRSE